MWCGRAGQARSSRHARRGCVYRYARDLQREVRGRDSPTVWIVGLCASSDRGTRECHSAFPHLSQPTFQICLLSRGLERRTKNPPAPAGMINEGSGREREARWRWHFPPASVAENARGPCAFITADRNGRKRCLRRASAREDAASSFLAV